MGEKRTVERDLRYQALPSQLLFHRSDARFKGFSGPVGSGKSQALCREALFLAYMNPGCAGLIGAPTFPMLKDATQAAFLQVLGDMKIPYDLNKAEQVLTLRETRSRILFRAVEEFDRLRGTNLAWFGLDELTYAPQEAWQRLEARLRDPKARRLAGFAVWTPKGHDWVWRRFVGSPVSGYEAILAKPYENRFMLDKVPDFYERLKSSYDERFFQQEVLGEYLNITEGRVYFAFDRERHVEERKLDPNKPLMWAVDFNVTPMSSVIAQRGDREIAILDEIVQRQSTTIRAAEEFCKRYASHRGGVMVYGDASGNTKQTSGLSDFQMIGDEFMRRGLTDYRTEVPRGNPLVRERVGLMNAMFGRSAGMANIVVHPKCRELIRDFEEVQYKPGTAAIDKEADPNRTHLSDAIGYLVWREFRPRPRAGEQGHRIL